MALSKKEKTYVIIGVVLVLAVAGYFIYQWYQNNQSGSSDSSTLTTPSAPTDSYSGGPSDINLTLPSASNQAQVSVPNEIGRKDLATAESMIAAAGLVPVAIGDSGAGNKGSVTAQAPSGGTMVNPGTAVTLTYTTGSGISGSGGGGSSGGGTGGGTGGGGTGSGVAVPNVVGRTDLDTAEGLIRAAGFKATASPASVTASKGNKGKVTSQSPTAGTKAAKGSTVTLTYTKG